MTAVDKRGTATPSAATVTALLMFTLRGPPDKTKGVCVGGGGDSLGSGGRSGGGTGSVAAAAGQPRLFVERPELLTVHLAPRLARRREGIRKRPARWLTNHRPPPLFLPAFAKLPPTHTLTIPPLPPRNTGDIHGFSAPSDGPPYSEETHTHALARTHTDTRTCQTRLPLVYHFP